MIRLSRNGLKRPAGQLFYCPVTKNVVGGVQIDPSHPSNVCNVTKPEA